MSGTSKANDPAPVAVSIVIVSWNARNYLLQCLESLEPGACAGSVEIIVVDNASSDGSADAVARNYPAVRLVRNPENAGFARANNIGISLAKGKYIALINSDVKVLPGCLDRLVQYLESHPDTGMVGPRILGGDGRLQRSCRGFPTVGNMFWRALALDSIFPRVRLFTGYSLRHWAQEDCRNVDILSGCFWMVRREALDQTGGLDESFFMYGEDVDWCRRFWNHGWKLAFVRAAEAIHYGGASSANAPVRFYIERHRADLQYWRKHHSRLAVGLYFIITCLHLGLRLLGYSAAALLLPARRAESRYKVRRSAAVLKWMFTEGLRRPKQSALPAKRETVAAAGTALAGGEVRTARYVLLTAAKNEEAYIAKAIEAVVRQTVPPVAWFIMDDGSTDRTAAIVESFAARHPFIRLNSAASREGRNFGSQYKALKSAYELAGSLEFDFVGMQDADIAPERPDYYESILGEFERNPRLGVAGGLIYEPAGEGWAYRKSNSEDSVAGGIQMFRRECFDQIGGYQPLFCGGSDSLALLDAKIHGWEILTRPDHRILHYRPTSTAGGKWRGLFRCGLEDASFGNHPVFELFKCGRRLANRPFVLGALVRLGGYLWWKLSGRRTVIPPEKVAFLRREQMAKLWRRARPLGFSRPVGE